MIIFNNQIITRNIKPLQSQTVLLCSQPSMVLKNPGFSKKPNPLGFIWLLNFWVCEHIIWSICIIGVMQKIKHHNVLAQ